MSNAENKPGPVWKQAYPDGRVEELGPATPEELAELQRTYLRDYDPETGELRSLQKCRQQSARTSPPSQESGQ